MIIWILAILFLACSALLGHKQGAIRVGISLIGIVFGALLAMPLSPLLNKVFPIFGIKNPLLISFLGPFVIFIIILALFKVIAMAVHRKVDVYYKYKAGDLRLALWERLNQRVGLCLGLLNGALYVLLLGIAIHAASYLTTQLATSDKVPATMRYLNKAGKDLQSSGLNKAVAAVDPVPKYYYEAADIVGLIYNNPLLESRLSQYPAFLAIGEKPEFQDIAKDTEFAELRQRQVPVGDLVKHPKTQAILNNSALLKEISNALIPNLKDLQAFLETGVSPKYQDEPILGRWSFDSNGAIMAYKKLKPNVPASELQKLRKFMASAFANTSFIAAPDHQAFLKGPIDMKPGGGNQSLQGQWQSESYKYKLDFSGQNLEGVIDNGRLTISKDGFALVFTKE